MEPRGASDIDGQTERSIWAGAHESKRGQRTSFNSLRTDDRVSAHERHRSTGKPRAIVVAADALSRCSLGEWSERDERHGRLSREGVRLNAAGAAEIQSA
jgi:hypothetical protein